MNPIYQKTSSLRLLFAILVPVIFSQSDILAEPQDRFAGLNLPKKSFEYENIQIPDYYFYNQFRGRGSFQSAAINHDNMPISNPTTNTGATLGRVLFYDVKLSAKGNIACASCHKQELGFADHAVSSLGFDGGKTRRHSMGLTNARFYQSGKFFWDERAATLEDQVLMPFQDALEMGLTLDQLVQLVQTQPYYPPLFQETFGDTVITSDRISKALAQFVRSIVSINSKYDQGRRQVNNRQTPFPNFTDSENSGKNIFFTNSRRLVACSRCHVSEAFIGSFPGARPNSRTGGSSNGLDMDSTDDLGIAETSAFFSDMGKFKTPSLRNVELIAPYMHDGRLATLKDVIDHYSTGIQSHPNLHRVLRFRDGRAFRYNFTDEEKAGLVAFLKTLTDKDLATDKKYSNPFE